MALEAFIRGEESEAAEVGALLVAECMDCIRGIAKVLGYEVRPSG